MYAYFSLLLLKVSKITLNISLSFFFRSHYAIFNATLTYIFVFFCVLQLGEKVSSAKHNLDSFRSYDCKKQSIWMAHISNELKWIVKIHQWQHFANGNYLPPLIEMELIAIILYINTDESISSASLYCIVPFHFGM